MFLPLIIKHYTKSISTLDDFDFNLMILVREPGSMIHTNSWGCDFRADPNCPDWYAQHARDSDEFMWANDDFLILFAIGNEGQQGPGSLTAEAMAKNIISVGGTGNGANANDMYDQGIDGTTGKGPTPDGRLKPTVLAPAIDVCSARSKSVYDNDPIFGECTPIYNLYVDAYNGGTSIAVPAVAGSAALVREYFQKGWYPTGEPVLENGFGPSAALVKATLIASAVEISGSGSHDNQYNGMDFPNVDQGWGRVTLDNALYIADNNDRRRLFIVDERGGLDNTGDWLDYFVLVADSEEPLKITLVWTDIEGISPCGPGCLRNNLNLEVTDPEGVVYRGNVFQGMNPGQSTTGGVFDHYNVEEVVLRYTPRRGLWRIRVIAETIDQPTQPFALVVTGDLTHEQTSSGGILGSPSNPSVATDSQGRTHVAWVQTLGDFDREIFYARYDEGQAMTHFVQLTDGNDDADGDDQFGPVIAVSPVDDAVYVVYANRNDWGGSAIEYYLDAKKSINGGDTWIDMSPPFGFLMPGYIYSSLSREIVDRADPIDLYIDSSGHLHLTWTSFLDDGFSIYEKVKYAQSEDGGVSWPTQETLHYEPYSSVGYDYYNKLRFPKIAKGRFDPAGGNDYVHAIFSYDDTLEPIGGPYSGWTEVKYVRSRDDGNSWAGALRLDDTHNIAQYNDLAANELGPEVVAVWQDDPTGVDKVYPKSSLNDGDLGTWFGGLSGGGVVGPTNQRYPALQMDISGFAHLAFAGGPFQSGFFNEIYFLSSLDGGMTWHHGTRVSFFAGDSTQPAIAVNRHGTFEIAWSDDRTGDQKIFYSTLPVVTRITHQSKHSFNPSIVVDSMGTTHMVWVDDREGDWDIYYAKYDKESKRASIDISLTNDFDDGDGDEQFGPVIAVAPDDSIYVVFAYQQEIDTNNLGYYLGGKKSTNGGNDWTTFDVVPGDYVYFSSFPGGYREIVDRADPIDLYIDSSGHLHLIWTQIYDFLALEAWEQVNYAQSEDGGGTWSPQYGLYTEPVYTEPGYRHYNRLRYPKVAKGQTSGGNEFVHAIFSWEDGTDPIGGPWVGSSEIRYVRSAQDGASGTWQPDVTIGTASHFGRYNDLAADEYGGGVIVVWHDWVLASGRGYDVHYARDTNDGLLWIDSGFVAGGGDDERWPALALDDDGHAHVLYSGYSATWDTELYQTTLLHLSSPSPTAWSIHRQLTLPWGGDTTAKIHPAATTAPSGTLLVAWYDAWGSYDDWTEIYILKAF